MKIREGVLHDDDRALIVQANRSRFELLVAAVRAEVHDSLGVSGMRGPDQFTGIPLSWTYETLTIGSWSGSFVTVVRWEDIRAVWLLRDAPPSEEVAELLA